MYRSDSYPSLTVTYWDECEKYHSNFSVITYWSLWVSFSLNFTFYIEIKRWLSTVSASLPSGRTSVPVIAQDPESTQGVFQE